MKSIEYYESLSKHEGLRKTIKASKCYTKLYRRDYLDKNTENGYYYQLRILQYKCIGLHFDEVFSLYKKQIVNLNKKDFLHYFSYGSFKFKNNILTYKPRKTNKKPIVYANGNWIKVEVKSQKPIESFPYYYRYNKKFKTERIYTGDILTFESSNDPKYKRCQAELLQKRKKEKKLRKKAFNEKSYSFISKKEIQLKEEKRLNKEKLYSHGFDDESFKGPHYRRKKEKKLKMSKKKCKECGKIITDGSTRCDDCDIDLIDVVITAGIALAVDSILDNLFDNDSSDSSSSSSSSDSVEFGGGDFGGAGAGGDW